MNNYYHLSPEERAIIMIQSSNGVSIRSIARLLNRSASTICRELKRNITSKISDYCASNAARQYSQRRKLCVRNSKLIPNTTLYNTVIGWLTYKQWSPMQISGTLKRFYPNQRDMNVSHETIYSCIYAHPKGELKKVMVQSLRRSKSKRGPRGSKSSNYHSVKLTDEQLFQNRPDDINERQLAGHWEGDLIAGLKKSVRCWNTG